MSSSTGDAARILVVEDEPTINQAVTDRLRAEGFTVDQAFDGPGAVAAFGQHSPDLVVLDVMLPGFTVLRLVVDGFELWLGLVVVLLLVAGIRLSGQWLARAILISAAVFTLAFAAMNPDAWVAQRNIQRFEAGQTLDTLYLSTLSADATPTLIDRLPAEVTRCMFGLRDYAPLRDDALAWNLGRDRAHAALESPEVVGPIANVGDCTQVITDDYRG